MAVIMISLLSRKVPMIPADSEFKDSSTLIALSSSCTYCLLIVSFTSSLFNGMRGRTPFHSCPSAGIAKVLNSSTAFRGTHGIHGSLIGGKSSVGNQSGNIASGICSHLSSPLISLMKSGAADDCIPSVPLLNHPAMSLQS